MEDVDKNQINHPEHTDTQNYTLSSIDNGERSTARMEDAAPQLL